MYGYKVKGDKSGETKDYEGNLNSYQKLLKNYFWIKKKSFRIFFISSNQQDLVFISLNCTTS